MWIFTVKGFFTFVTDRKDPSYLWLRARMREHIEDNFPGVTAEMKPGADYLWRAKVKRDDVALRIAELVMESNVDSHFKDVMIRTAAKPKTGNLSKVMYAVWNGAAEWQEYAPYSKVPRAQEKTTWKNTSADRRPGQGQTTLPYQSGGSSRPLEPYRYGGSGGGRFASDFDWDARDWGGVQHKDPVPASSGVPADAVLLPDDYTEDEWARMTADEQQAALDAEEAELRAIEALEEDQGTIARLEGMGADLVTHRADAYPAPRNRPGKRRKRRQNRHNQYRQMGFSDSQAAEEARNRQTYLDRKAARKARKDGGN
jgi:hypothetical protein